MSFRELLFPTSWMYQGLTSLRNWLYDRSVLRKKIVDVPVISIGNVTMGGTGKTPVTLALIEMLHQRGLTCGVVSRGYKREYKGVFEVEIKERAAQRFGDEPVLIKSLFPDSPVFVGEQRVAAARALIAKKNVDVLLCDDAFQHRRLHRDLNLLLLDVTEPRANYRVLPVGRARESLVPALRRANFIILTKSNLVTGEELTVAEEWLKSKTSTPYFFAEYVCRGLRYLGGGTGASRIEKSLPDSVYLVSGIAKPAALEKTLEGKVGIVKHRTFSDHHSYVNREVEEILDETSRLQARWVLTTAKDSMKLSAFPRLRERLWVVDLGVEFKGDLQAFHATMDRFSRTNS